MTHAKNIRVSDPDPIVAALTELARNVGRIASGEHRPDGLEGVAMSIGHIDHPLSDSIDSAGSMISSAISDLSNSVDALASAVRTFAGTRGSPHA